MGRKICVKVPQFHGTGHEPGFCGIVFRLDQDVSRGEEGTLPPICLSACSVLARPGDVHRCFRDTHRLSGLDMHNDAVGVLAGLLAVRRDPGMVIAERLQCLPRIVRNVL